MYEADENGAIDVLVNRSSSQGETPIVQALYSYSYEMQGGQQVSFEAGDCFVLLEKSTEDWWHVRKDNENFYVPANYMCESFDFGEEESSESLNSQGEVNTLSPSSESSFPEYEGNAEEEALGTDESSTFGGNDAEGIYENIPRNVKEVRLLRN